MHKHHQELLNGKEDPPKNGEGADTTGSSGGSNEISRPDMALSPTFGRLCHDCICCVGRPSESQAS